MDNFDAFFQSLNPQIVDLARSHERLEQQRDTLSAEAAALRAELAEALNVVEVLRSHVPPEQHQAHKEALAVTGVRRALKSWQADFATLADEKREVEAEAAALREKLADVLQILEAPNMRELQEIYLLTIKSARKLLAANSAKPCGTCGGSGQELVPYVVSSTKHRPCPDCASGIDAENPDD